MRSTVYSTVWPVGSRTSVLAPTALFSRAWPTGLSSLILPFRGAAHDIVFLGLVLTGHPDDHMGAHRHAVHTQLALINDDSVLDHLLQLGDAVLHQTLGVLGLVVLAVLRQVAVAACFLDLFSQLLAADRFEVFQFLLHCLQTGGGHLDLLCHFENLSLSICFAQPQSRTIMPF